MQFFNRTNVNIHVHVLGCPSSVVDTALTSHRCVHVWSPWWTVVVCDSVWRSYAWKWRFSSGTPAFSNIIDTLALISVQTRVNNISREIIQHNLTTTNMSIATKMICHSVFRLQYVYKNYGGVLCLNTG